MSSNIFQPLLNDPLGWKFDKSTYTDHFKWRKFRSTSKTKKISVEKNEEKIRAKTAIVRPESRKFSGQIEKRPVSAVEGSISTVEIPVVAENSSKENFDHSEKEIRTENVEENHRHWLTYPNPSTPQYILEIKQRLGQLKKSSLNSAEEEKVLTKNSSRPSSASTQKKETNLDEQRRYFDFERRQTPDELRQARFRLDKHRYNPSLDNFSLRPQTAPVDQTRNSSQQNQINGNTEISTGNEFAAQQQTEQNQLNVRTDAWTEQIHPTVNDQTANERSENFLVQFIDEDSLPPEYGEALKTAAIAQQEYQRNRQMTPEKIIDLAPPISRPSSQNQNDSLMAYQNQLPTTVLNNNFGHWIRNSTEKERASAMKILQDVLHKPVVGYDPVGKKKSQSKQAPAPPPVRAVSATRKLGRTRNQHRFPCEICEKLLIKRHVWDLNRPENNVCSHQPERSSVRS